MARPLRLQFDGALYHVTSRGNARADIFDDDGDRHTFLECLEKVVHRLAVNWVLRQFGQDRHHAASHYRRFVREGINRPSIWEGVRA